MLILLIYTFILDRQVKEYFMIFFFFFRVRQNYHTETEGLINKHINMELYASYVYLSMSAYFDR